MVTPRTVDDMFSMLAAALLSEPGVTRAEAPRRTFGSGTLKVHGKIFAMVTPKGQVVVKLSAPRVAALVAAGVGTHYDPGHGRMMKAWLQITTPSLDVCRPLFTEAKAQVSGIVAASTARPRKG